MADPIRFDPNAKFDNEVARMAEEHDADVVLKLADRKAATMAEGHSCAVCTESTEATHRMILHKDRGAPQTIEVCERHGMWLKEGAQPGITPRNTDQKQVNEIKPELAAAKHVQGRRITEAPDRGAGGGPGGRAMAPELPPPPEKVDRTYDTAPDLTR